MTESAKNYEFLSVGGSFFFRMVTITHQDWFFDFLRIRVVMRSKEQTTGTGAWNFRLLLKLPSSRSNSGSGFGSDLNSKDQFISLNVHEKISLEENSFRLQHW